MIHTILRQVPLLQLSGCVQVSAQLRVNDLFIFSVKQHPRVNTRKIFCDRKIHPSKELLLLRNRSFMHNSASKHIRTYSYVHTHMCIHTCTYTYVHTHMFIFLLTYIYTYMYARIYTNIYLCTNHVHKMITSILEY